MFDRGSVKPWVHLIGGITIVAALWAAKDLVFPVVLAALLTFVLSGPVSWLERRVGRVPAVLGAVGLGFAALAIALWVMTWQLDGLVNNLPRYRQTLVTKLADLKDSGRGGAVDELQKTIEDVKEGLSGTSSGDRRRRSTVVLAERLESGEAAFPWLGSVVGIATRVGVVVTLVVFMLLERRDLRDRIIGLIGHGHVALTTRALDEAGARVSRQLLMQSAVNGLYGVAAAAGLWYVGVPHALVWACLGAVLRFIPYLGPILGAGAPIVFSIAATEGWSVTIQVVALYVVVELFTNLVLETVLYAGAAGVSQVGLLLSVTFWTWLWGPAGLLVATPLTVVLVVMGKHVRGLEVIATLLADMTTLTAAQGCYQRLLARDTAEAADIVERHVRTEPPRSVYDELLLPVLAFVEADRLENRVTSDDEGQVIGALQELVAEAAEQVRAVEAESLDPASRPDVAPVVRSVHVLGWAANGPSDELALAMLARMVDDLPVEIRIGSRLMPSEIIDAARDEGLAAVCLVDLPPRSPSRTRYVLKKLRAQAPQLRIFVARWAPPEFADTSAQLLIEAGASQVSPSLAHTRTLIESLVAPRP
jgi:predicted PurR-regulated permease PerM